MPARDPVELDICSVPPQSLGITLRDGRRIVFVSVPGDVQYRRGHRLVRAVIPVAR